MKSNKVKLYAIVLAITLALSVLTSYSSESIAKAETISKQEITYSLGENPKTLDPALNIDNAGINILVNAFVGLCELDENGKVIKGDAESWEVSSDGLTYTFHLRKDLKWSNGDSLKASDYEYAWKRVLNPEIAGEYSYQLLCIKGAEAYNTGNGSADDVRIKAIDDNTLVVMLEAPTQYFLELTSQVYYFPVNQKVVESNKDWATNSNQLVSNGPFKITDYKIKDQIILEKNENYYDKDKVKLDKVSIKFVSEEISAWESYKTGQVDIVDSVPRADVQGALIDGSAKAFPNLGTYYLSINVSDKAKAVDPNAAKVLNDVKVRKALSIAIDRQLIVDKVTKGGEIPAHGMVSKGIVDTDGKDFTDKNIYFDSNGNIEEAKKLLAEAGYPEGRGIPQLILSYNQESGNAYIMQAIQDMWGKIGIDVKLQSQEWKSFLKNRVEKNYEIARNGWIGDYVDPMTFLDMFISTSGQNDCGYNNPEYDKIINAAKSELDVVKRMGLLHKAEDLLMGDMPIIPIYHYARVMGIKDYLKDVRVSEMDNIYLKNAYIEDRE